MKSTRTSLSLFVLTISASFLLAQPPKFKPGCPLPAPLADIAEVHSIDKTCSIRGFSQVAEKIAESRAKNNFCASGPPVDVSYDVFKELQQAVEDAHVHLDDRQHPARPSGTFATSAGTLGEGNQVRFVAFVLKAKYSNTKKQKDGHVGENVNCNKPTGANNDVHIVLLHSQDDDEEESVTAEAIPHERPSAGPPATSTSFAITCSASRASSSSTPATRSALRPMARLVGPSAFLCGRSIPCMRSKSVPARKPPSASPIRMLAGKRSTSLWEATSREETNQEA